MIGAEAPTGFGGWQPLYAAHGIPTFPVKISESEKRPAVRGYLKIGLDRSRQLARQRPDADAFGFVCGKRSGVTVLDIDTPDENVLADALGRHGKTPVIVRSGGHGHWQAWYKWNGERRRIRPDKGKPIDWIGGGYVVAPPSRGASGQYEIVEGSLDDLDRLPVISAPPASAVIAPPVDWGSMGQSSGRNNALFRRLGREAHVCDDFNQLLDRAQTLNAEFAIPMDSNRVATVAQSVWQMTIQGRNRFGQHGSFFPVAEIEKIVGDPYLVALLAWLRANNGPESVFMVADGLASRLDWPRRQLSAARQRAIAGGWIKQVSPAFDGHAARYVWNGGGGSLASGPLDGPLASPPSPALGPEQTTLVEDHLPELVGLKLKRRSFSDLPKAVGLNSGTT
jgi:hypothetical protein